MKLNEIRATKNIFQNGIWYHTVDFEDVTSKGTFDYRKLINELNIPNMKNQSVLDIGCSDGFFTYHFLDKLEAKNVTGVDINKYDGSVAFDVLENHKSVYEKKYSEQNDFDRLKSDYEILKLSNGNKYLLLKKIFDLNCNFEYGSIYNLNEFDNYDITFCGSLLEHLRDPITAIEQMYLKTNNFCIIDVSNSFNTGLFSSRKNYLKYTGAGGNFYHYSWKAIKSMMENSGFKNVSLLNDYKIKIEKYNYKIPHILVVGYK